MARPGPEPGTPRFSGERVRRLSIRRKRCRRCGSPVLGFSGSRQRRRCRHPGVCGLLPPFQETAAPDAPPPAPQRSAHCFRGRAHPGRLRWRGSKWRPWTSVDPSVSQTAIAVRDGANFAPAASPSCTAVSMPGASGPRGPRRARDDPKAGVDIVTVLDAYDFGRSPGSPRRRHRLAAPAWA
jgi:hypothetical protein